MQHRATFNPDQIRTINQAVAMAEELVSEYYKMSASQWLRPKYDIKTLADLAEHEIIEGPFAQLVRYEGQLIGSSLGSKSYDFYKICLQDHAILAVLQQSPDLTLLPFGLYIITHELIHIVRFSKFLQNFDASPAEKLVEERRVHETTHNILMYTNVTGMAPVFLYYQQWRAPLEALQSP